MKRLPAALGLLALLPACDSLALSKDERHEAKDALARERDGGWNELFDGKTLAGWVTKGGRYEGNALWTVEDGAITGRQSDKREGGLIFTAVPYTDFELELDVRLDEPFDSGIFLRMAPAGKGAQVTLDLCPNGELGAIYADGFLQHNAEARKLWKSGAWNHVTVKITGNPYHIVSTINGAPLVDYQQPAGMEGFVPTGLVGLQVHGQRDDPPQNKVQFKNLRLRELTPTSREMFTEDGYGLLTLTPWGEANGWKPLFDGHSLAGWEPLGQPTGYAAKDGVLSLLTQGGSETLATKEDFQDFELRLDFKISAMANSGLFLRAARDGSNPAFSGCEVQILDDFNWETQTKSTLKPWQHTGSLYGSIASGEPKAMKPLGEWNTYSVRYAGTSLTTKLNGKELYSVDTAMLSPEQGEPFAKRAPKGFIGLQRHAGDVQGEAYAWFRNVFVRKL
ncbi:MAG: DUF1080 domain-containing protein [Planctomycetes bacterium]|nr:DUF1080 domain-containing protein [Planctomycetota bacterium]